MRKIYLLALVLTTVFSACSQEPVKKKSPVIENINIKTFKKLSVKDGIILDVRTKDEVEQGVIKGAINIDYTDLNFKENIKSLDTNKTVYVYCRSGGRSSKASMMLKQQGFKKVYNLIGGITEWEKEGMLLDKLE